MKRISRRPLLPSLALLPALAGCTTSAPTNTATPNTNSTAAASHSPAAPASPASSPSPSPSPAAEASVPVTLPVLDAMFADSSFARALQAKLQLTDEQVARLRQIAREETAKLSESKAQTGTTSEATRSAAEKIKGIVGEEQLAAFTA